MATVDVLTFICVSEDTFERSVAYTFLARVADELVKQGLQVSGYHNSRRWCANCCCLVQEQAKVCGPYALRLEFGSKLSELLREYSATDRVTALASQVRQPHA